MEQKDDIKIDWKNDSQKIIENKIGEIINKLFELWKQDDSWEYKDVMGIKIRTETYKQLLIIPKFYTRIDKRRDCRDKFYYCVSNNKKKYEEELEQIKNRLMEIIKDTHHYCPDENDEDKILIKKLQNKMFDLEKLINICKEIIYEIKLQMHII
jgi:hypothetical protein